MKNLDKLYPELEKVLNQKIEEIGGNNSIKFNNDFIKFNVIMTEHDDAVYIIKYKDLKCNEETFNKIKAEFDLSDDMEGCRLCYKIGDYVAITSPLYWIYDETSYRSIHDTYEECYGDVLEGNYAKCSTLPIFLKLHEKHEEYKELK